MTEPLIGKTVMAGKIETKFEITSDMVDQAYCIVRQSIVPGQLFWPHVHQNEVQVIVVLHGTLGVRVGDREWHAKAGELVHRPKQIPHTIWNDSNEVVHFLEITSPGGFDHYFAALGQMAQAGDFSGQPDLIARYGIQPVEGWVEDLGKRYGVQL